MKVKLLTGCVTLMMIVTSCVNDSGYAPALPIDDGAKSVEAFDMKLPVGLKDLTASDAETLAGIYADRDKTRATGGKSVKNVVAINDSNGNPAIYAVNFNEGGYILVSATTKYVPVLAIVDKGEYSADNEKTGEDVVISDMITNITLAKENKIDENYRSLWLQYMESDKPVRETRGSDDYYEELDRWYAEHTADGSQIYKLTRLQDELPEDVYNRFVETASADDAWSGTQYSWESTAYVVVQTTSDVTVRGPLLNTTWDQNGDVSPRIACVPVAVGQIMRFYEYPAAFPWNSMSDSYYYDDSKKSFLMTIRNDLNVDEKDGGSNIGSAKRVLKSYGYSVSQTDHEATKIYSEIAAGRPVYARGHDASRNKSHAWVIDGTRYSYTSVTYTLYILNSNCYPEFNYEESGTSPWNQYSSLTTYHMNWGWGGSNNGWFLDYRINFTDNEGTVRNYSNNRKELLIRKP